MRSDLVQQATAAVSNRFLLVHVASTLTRKFHRRMKDRLPETINSSLAGLAEGRFLFKGNVLRPGVPDLDTYNGFTGEGVYSYVNPIMAAQMVETA
jgi:hypothetical protein